MGCCGFRTDTPNEEGRVVFISSGIWQVTDVDVLIVPAKDMLLNEEQNLKNIGMFKACEEWDPKSTYSQQDKKCLVQIVHTKSRRLEKNNRIQNVFHYIVGEDYELNNMTPTKLAEQLGALFELCATNNFNRVAIHTRIPGTYNISIGECAKIYKSVFETYQQIRKIKIVGNENEIKDFKMQYNLANIGQYYQNHQSINPERQKQENVIILENQDQQPQETEQRQQESQQNGNQEPYVQKDLEKKEKEEVQEKQEEKLVLGQQNSQQNGIQKPQEQKDIQQQEKEVKQEKQGEKPLESTLGQQVSQQNGNQEPYVQKDLEKKEKEEVQEKQEEKLVLGQQNSQQNGIQEPQEQKDIQQQEKEVKQEQQGEKPLESTLGQQVSQQNGNQEPQEQEKEVKQEKQGEKPLESTLGQQVSQQNGNQEPQEQEKEVKQEKQGEKPLESALGQKDSEQNGNQDHQEQKDIQEQDDDVEIQKNQEEAESVQGQQASQLNENPELQQQQNKLQVEQAEVTPQKLRILVEQNNLVKLQDVDAIVNAANSQLAEGGGVCGAIFNACGSNQLTKQCQAYLDENGTLKTSGVAVTTSCRLSKQGIKSIIHAVGPMYHQSQDPVKELYDCVLNVLKVTFLELQYKSVAIPAISSGIFGFPKKLCAQTFLKAIQQFRNENKDVEGEVRLTNFDNETYRIFERVFEGVD